MIKHSHNKLKQQGAALVVGLLLLLVLTVLAISSMGSAALETIMAGNEQYRQNAFQAAEAGIAANLSNPGQFIPGMTTANTTDNAVSGSTSGDTYDTAVAWKSSLPKVSCPGSEANFGTSTGGGSCDAFEITSTGHSRRGSLAVNLQGLTKFGPSDNTMSPNNPAGGAGGGAGGGIVTTAWN